MTALPADQRMKVTVHVAEASATLSAIRLNTQRAPRTLEYTRHLDMLEQDLLGITARLTDVRPDDWDLTQDLQ